ncbi:TetR/AcrR family transcriptional regulator [Brevundimonas sp.]|uniref:TetR/AcrR family transcriptional regulator n=1 Tax=Brevundimonas sp. TaxID=1871086 RepID=UPI0025D2CC14|nr:TetR/AcrR family transcriptional regulator [Brevundimonas sp.]
MTDEKRPYRLRERARAQEETRRRIVEAAMQLHESIGPRATTVSAIAERSGVQRLTVYRHFPDEAAIFQACSSHWSTLNPPPEPGDWADIADPAARFSAAATALYGYFSRAARMLSSLFADLPHVPALMVPMSGFFDYLDGVSADLIGAFDGVAPSGHVAPTIRHALRFPTWSDLDAQGLDDAGKVALVSRWLCGPPPARP